MEGHIKRWPIVGVGYSQLRESWLLGSVETTLQALLLLGSGVKTKAHVEVFLVFSRDRRGGACCGGVTVLMENRGYLATLCPPTGCPRLSSMQSLQLCFFQQYHMTHRTLTAPSLCCPWNPTALTTPTKLHCGSPSLSALFSSL